MLQSIKSLQMRIPNAKPRCVRSRHPSLRLQVEGLEERAVPASIGALDPTFGTGGVALVASAGLGSGFDAAAEAVQSDGKIVLAGSAQIAGRETVVVARLAADGKSLDPSFGNNGLFALTSVQGSATGMQLDGSKIVVGGSFFNGSGQAFNSTDFFLLRLTSSGTLDDTFGEPTVGGLRAGLTTLDSGHNDQAGKLIIDGNGEYLLAGTCLNVAGSNQTNDMALARFNTLGQPDGSFGNGVPGLFKFDHGTKLFNDLGSTVAFQNGEYLLAGGTDSGGILDPVVLRVLPSGAGLDTSFGSSGVALDQTNATPSQISDIAVQSARSGGQIVVVGTDMKANQSAFVASVDPRGFFGQFIDLPVPNRTEDGFGVAVDAQDRVIVAGDAISSANDSDVLLARFTPNLTPDTTFGQSGTGIVIQNLGFSDDSAAAVLAPSTSTIVVAGISNQSMLAARFVADVPPAQANDDTVAVAANSSANSIDVLANDTGAGLQIIGFQQPDNGSVRFDTVGQRLLYTPARNYAGSDSFEYRIVDSEGNTSLATVHIMVVGVNPGGPSQTGITGTTPPAAAPPAGPTTPPAVAPPTSSLMAPAAPGAHLAIQAPRIMAARGEVLFFRAGKIAITHADPSAPLTLRVTAGRGKLTMKAAGVKIVGNNSRALVVTGTLAALNRALGTGMLNIDGAPSGKVALSLFVSGSSQSSHAAISVR